MTSIDADQDELRLILKVGSAHKGSVELSLVAHCRTAEENPVVGQVSSDRHTVRLFQFTDDESFSILDSVLVQLGGKSVVLCESCSTLSSLVDLFDAQSIEAQYVPKAALYNSFDIISHIRDRISQQGMLAQLEKERDGCISLLYNMATFLDWRISVPENVVLDLIIDTPNLCMILDSVAADAVGLLPRKQVKATEGSLLGLFSMHCRSKVGAKTLERWLRQPLLDIAAIEARQDVVGLLKDDAALRCALRDQALSAFPDLHPVLHKLRSGRAGLAELLRMYMFARAMASLNEVLRTTSATSDLLLLSNLTKRVHSLSQSLGLLCELAETALEIERLPELRLRATLDPSLSQLRSKEEEVRREAERVRDEEVRRGGVAGELKLEEHDREGLVLRSPRLEDERVVRNPPYRLVSILKTGVVFSTHRLQTLGERLQSLRAEAAEQEQELVQACMQTAQTYMAVLQTALQVVGEIDALQSLATQAALAPAEYVRPKLLPVSDGVQLSLRALRHPCLEVILAAQSPSRCFVANDLDLDKEHVCVITGPNMGGKSTLLRAVGAIAVLSQVGAFVPCSSCQMTLCSALLVRVGAQDHPHRHMSTFFVEMKETAAALMHTSATPRGDRPGAPLLLLDELGRGTSTQEGAALATAVLHFLLQRCEQTRVLCATHFQELTRVTGVQNRHVAAALRTPSAAFTDEMCEEEVRLLYELRPGPCTQSLGLEVAVLADMPTKVVRDARRALHPRDWTEDEAHEAVKRMRRFVSDCDEEQVPSRTEFRAFTHHPLSQTNLQ